MQSSSQTKLILLALWLMVFSASSQVIIISPILPELGVALSIPEALQGTLVTAYAILLSIFAWITGPISDKVGRRRVLLIGCGAMAVVLLLHGIVNSYFAMLVVRALAGAAGGILSGAAVAYVGDYFPYEKRGWANGWIMSGIAVGQILGIPVGKLLATLLGFRWPFLMYAATMLVATVLVWWFVPQPNVVRNTARLTIKGVLVTYSRMIREFNVFVAAAVYFLMFCSIGLYVVYLPKWLEGDVGVLGTEIASLFLVGGLANVVTSPLAGRVSDQVGRKPLIIISCLGFGVLMLATTYAISGIWMAYLFFGLAMVMVALRMSPLQSLLSALVPAERRGMLMSLAIGIGQIGMAIGSSAAGFLYQGYGYVSNTVLAAVLILAMAWLVIQYLPEPHADAESPQPAASPQVAKATS